MPIIGQFQISDIARVSYILHERWGRIVRLGGLLGRPDLLFVYDADEIEKVSWIKLHFHSHLHIYLLDSIAEKQMDLHDRKNLTFIFISNAQFMQILKISSISANERSTNSPLSSTHED